MPVDSATEQASTGQGHYGYYVQNVIESHTDAQGDRKNHDEPRKDKMSNIPNAITATPRK